MQPWWQRQMATTQGSRYILLVSVMLGMRLGAREIILGPFHVSRETR